MNEEANGFRMVHCGFLKVHARSKNMLDAYKELVPVLYGENGIKIHNFSFGPHDMCFHAHWHERLELLFMLSGTLEAYLDDEHVTVLPGQTVIIMPHMIHCGFSGDRGASYIMIAFDVENFCNHTIASDKYLMPVFQQKTRFCHVTDHPKITEHIRELAPHAATDGEFHPLCTIGKIYEIIGLLCQHCSIGSGQIHKPDERFGMVLTYINSHYTEDISARDICQKFGYEETYFCRRFKEATGITTMRYIRILRLELAQKLLRDGREDIRTISWRCGFSDISYFSNCFKRHLGVTPTEFRNAALG